MKYLILLTCLITTNAIFSQYSTYYVIPNSNTTINANINSTNNTNINSNINANINHNISGTVFENKTIRTIDYGALAIANAENQRLIFEQQKFADERQKNIALEIASDPLKAFDYGYWNNFCTNNRKIISKEDAIKFQQSTGFKNFCMSHVIPNTILFSNIGPDKFQNVTNEGVKTELVFFPPTYNKMNAHVDPETQWRGDNLIVGELFESTDETGQKRKYYLHKKDFNRADVFGTKGVKATAIWEDDFEYGITDTYMSFNNTVGNGYMMMVKARYYGDKDQINFEQLEGRRYYFRLLVDKIISTGKIYDLKL